MGKHIKPGDTTVKLSSLTRCSPRCSPDAPEKADHVLDQIEMAFSSLATNPERGACPKELLAIGLREYREIFFKPYRIIYRVMAENVYVMVIVDGRRDLQTLLQRRLLQA